MINLQVVLLAVMSKWTRRTCGRFIGMLFFLLIVAMPKTEAQNQFNARFNLVSVDTISRVACYDIELSNAGNITWLLGAYNISILYDARAACYTSDTLISDDIVYSYGVQSNITSTTLTNLPYRDSIGFIRVNLAPEDQPASLDTLRDLLDTVGTWVPTVRVCFDIKLTDITSPETCLQIDFATEDQQAAFMLPRNTMQEWAGAFVLIDVDPVDLQSVLPNRSRNSCFVLEENTVDLCSDGIDNDEDGLTDCMDIDGCSPGILAATVGLPTCFDSLGVLTIVDGQGDNLSYSIDGGITFQEDSIFMDIPAGTYSVLVTRNGIMTSACTFETPVVLRAPNCDEFDDTACANGIDDDGDGLIDCNDPDCLPTINEIIAVAPDQCPELNNGSISIATSYPNADYSIDGGANFSADITFTDLIEGDYQLIIRNATTGCIADTMPTISLLANPPCAAASEICRDGEDNDNDGLIDCQDPDCLNDPICEPAAIYYIPNIMSLSSALNGIFEIKTPSNAPLGISELNIFDRYGNVLFRRENTSTVDPNHAWDGRYNNQIVNPGVYVYQVILTLDGQPFNIAGDITVLQ